MRDLLSSLHDLSNPTERFGRLFFCEQTVETIDLMRPVDFDISALLQAGDIVVAAVFAVIWSNAFAAKGGANMLADVPAGTSPATMAPNALWVSDVASRGWLILLPGVRPVMPPRGTRWHVPG